MTTRPKKLVVISITLIVIGLLLWGAVNCIEARRRSQRRACIGNMHSIDGGLCSMDIEEPWLLTNIVTSADMPSQYLKNPPNVMCPCAGKQPYIIRLDLAFLQSTNRPEMKFKGDLPDDAIVVLCPAAVNDPVRYGDHTIYDTTNTLRFIEQQHRAADKQ